MFIIPFFDFKFMKINISILCDALAFHLKCVFGISNSDTVDGRAKEHGLNGVTAKGLQAKVLGAHTLSRSQRIDKLRGSHGVDRSETFARLNQAFTEIRFCDA